MRTAVFVAIAIAIAVAGQRPLDAQARGARGRGAAAAAPTIAPAELKCPLVLGDGVKTGRTFCDVQIGRDPAEGILVTIPPHTGDVTLTFDLHNRHTYSEQQVKNDRGYHRYLAMIGVLTMDNFLVSRAAVMSEFRTAADLVDRIGGGGGAGGLKAVAPTGTEPVVMTFSTDADTVSILGEKLNVMRVDGVPEDFTTVGRPIAVISNVMLEYRPAPARRTPARR
jgi:hypothetical protein